MELINIIFLCKMLLMVLIHLNIPLVEKIYGYQMKMVF